MEADHRDHKGRAWLDSATLKKIHMARRRLRLDDDDYRAILQRECDVNSAADITSYEQVMRLQREFRRLGMEGYLLRRDQVPPLPYEDCDRRPGMPNGAQLRKLEAIFNNISGYAEINPEAALRAFLENRFGISDIRFLDLRKYEVALKGVREILRRNGRKRKTDGDVS